MIIYAPSKSDFDNEFDRYKACHRSNYYNGKLEIERASRLDVRMDRLAAQPVTINQLLARTPIKFSRTWVDVCQDEIDVYVAMIVNRGHFSLITSRCSCHVQAGELIIVPSNTAFIADALLDEAFMHESTHIIVPGHTFRSHIPSDFEFERPISCSSGDGYAVQTLFGILKGHGPSLSCAVANDLLNSALKGVAACIRDVGQPERLTVAGRRLKEIEAFIEAHLTDRHLSLARLAAAMEVTERYICKLLNSQGTSFSRLVWPRRLSYAQQLMRNRSKSGYTIAEISATAGFKSPAHFSRAFHDEFGITPMTFRHRHCGSREIQ